MSMMASHTVASRLFTQPFNQAQIKENIKAPHHWPCAGKSPVTGEFPAQRASNAANISIWWPHHVCTHPGMYCTAWCYLANIISPGQNGHHIENNIFRCIFVNEKFCILMKISLKFVRKGPIDSNPALVEVMASHWIGDKLLFEHNKFSLSKGIP